jgi:UDP-glucose 4-epimerase
MISSAQFQNKRVLITGGMGFLGSNLAISLVGLGAEVTIVDSMIPGYGGNLFNIAPVAKQLTVNFADIRDQHVMNYLVTDKDYIFHLAGQVDHILSLSNPFPDIDINITGTAVLMEALRLHNPRTRVIYTGTRGQYVESAHLPVAEDAPTYPKGLHEISNLTAEQIVSMYHAVHQIPAVLLRLTNIYGERAQMRHPRYGVVNWFIRLAIDNETIKVFGDGKILRDFLYVEDSIDAMLMVAINENAYGEIFNVASGQALNFIELAKTLIEVAETGRWEFAPFSPERAAQEPGDFYADIRKIKRVVGWEPRVSLHDGLASTVKFYRENRRHYWE